MFVSIRWTPLLMATSLLGHSMISAKELLPDFRQRDVISQSCQQLIMVVTDDWQTVKGTLWRLEREPDQENWKHAGGEWPIVVGRNGMGWGIGVHGGPPSTAKHVKREGDGCAPAGVFALVEMFGKFTAQESGVKRFPYRQMRSTTRGIDDPRSRHYNRIVDLAVIEQPDWQSAERMLRRDTLYDLGVVIAHNWKPFRDRGSCIFIHTWSNPNVGTAGCTAMAATRIKALVQWLDHSKNPLLVQLPRSAYGRLRQSWALPKAEG